jgi:transposase
MTGQRKRPFLDDEARRREILAILSVGGSQRTAAAYVGCSKSTIFRTAQRDAEFGAKLRRAQYGVEVGYLRNLQKAAKKEQYWRAAAWALERLNPEEFGNRRTVPVADVTLLLERLADFIVKSVRDPAVRRRIIHRVRRLLQELHSQSETKAKRRDK